MTDHDLATLLRRHVADEPAYDQAADVVVSQGRRAVRRKRSGAALLGTAAMAFAAVFVVPQFTTGSSGPDRVIDPGIADAIEVYDVATMPRTMDEHARRILETSVPNLRPGDFVAFDSQTQKLPERYWPKASGLTVFYGQGTPHRLSVTLSHSRGEAEGDPDRYCGEGLTAGFYLECTVESTKDGDVVITTLRAQTLEWPAGSGLQNWRDQFMAVPDDELGSTAPDRLWFSRDVKVIKSETFVTYVSETVQAPDLATAQEQLLVPPGDLAAIGLDRALVMPKPPPGDNGCPQWTMPTMDVSCASAR